MIKKKSMFLAVIYIVLNIFGTFYVKIMFYKIWNKNLPKTQSQCPTVYQWADDFSKIRKGA